MAQVTLRFADYLSTHSPADLERRLGIAVGDRHRTIELNRPKPLGAWPMAPTCVPGFAGTCEDSRV